jgi:hypothetical protein
MFDATQTSHQASSAKAPTTPRGRASYFELVEDDTYADWEAAYVDNADHIDRLVYTGVGNQPDADDTTAQVLKAAFDPETDLAVRDEHSEPEDGEAGHDAGPVVSDLRLLKSMSVRDAAVAACISEGSGEVVQYRALFMAGNLAQRDR